MACANEILFVLQHHPHRLSIPLAPCETLGTLKELIHAHFDLTPKEQRLEGFPASVVPFLQDNVQFGSLNLPSTVILTVNQKSDRSRSRSSQQSASRVPAAGPSFRTEASYAEPENSSEEESEGEEEKQYEFIIETEFSNADKRVLQHPCKMKLRFPGSKMIGTLKEEVAILTRLPTPCQLWTGWPLGTTNNLLLKDISSIDPSQPFHLKLEKDSFISTGFVPRISKEAGINLNRTLRWHKCPVCTIFFANKQDADNHHQAENHDTRDKCETEEETDNRTVMESACETMSTNSKMSNTTSEPSNINTIPPDPAVAVCLGPTVDGSRRGATNGDKKNTCCSTVLEPLNLPGPSRGVTSTLAQPSLPATTRSQKKPKEEDDKPFVRPPIKTIADLKKPNGRGRGRGRGRGGGIGRVSHSSSSSDEEYTPAAEAKGGPPPKRGRGGLRGRGRVAAVSVSAVEPPAPFVGLGHVLSDSAVAPQNETAEDRRSRMKKAAESRLKAQEGKGFQNLDSVHRRIRRNEEQQKREDAAAKLGGSGLKWPVQK